MVQTYELPFGALNRLPGVSGIEDVVIEIPESEDIADAVEDAVPTLADIRQAVGEEIDQLDTSFGLTGDAIDELVATLVEEIETSLDIDLPSSTELQELIDIVQDFPDLSDVTVDIDGSLFSVEDEFVDLLALALDQVDFLDVSEFPSLTEVDTLVQEAIAEQVDIDVPTLDDIDRVVQEAVEAVSPDVNGAELFTEPVEFFRQVGIELADDLVSDEAEAELQESVDN